MKTIREEGREIPVRAEVDVLVAGGGLGGVSAAMAAARAGAKTLLVERNSFLGGVATAGMCCSMFNAFYTASGKLGTTGNALEAADALAEAAGYGERWKRHKAHIIYDVEGCQAHPPQAGCRRRGRDPLRVGHLVGHRRRRPSARHHRRKQGAAGRPSSRR